MSADVTDLLVRLDHGAALLLVDDDAPIRRMLERTLTAEGYDVEAVADGGAALAAVERNVPDAIVLDVTMPGLDGLAGHPAAARQGPARADPAADRARRGRTSASPGSTPAPTTTSSSRSTSTS